MLLAADVPQTSSHLFSMLEVDVHLNFFTIKGLFLLYKHRFMGPFF